MNKSFLICLIIFLVGCAEREMSDDKFMQAAKAKELSQNAGKEKAIELIKQAFYLRNYDNKIQDLAAEGIRWEAKWPKAHFIQYPDSAVLCYIPLEMEKEGKKVPFIGSNKFVVVKLDKEFIFTLQTFTDAKNYVKGNKYSGIRLIKNLQNDRLNVYEIESGLVKKNGKNKNNKNSVAGCTNYWTCYWRNESICSGGYVHTSGIDGCYYPESANICGHWQQVQTIIEPVCTYDYSGFDPYYNYNPYDPSSPIVEIPADYNPAIAYESFIVNELRSNKAILLGPCPGLTDAWKKQINLYPSQAVVDKLKSFQMKDPYHAKWNIQAIQNGSGNLVNLDRFAIKMDKLPMVGTRMMTPGEFVHSIRTNLTYYSGTKFEPHPALGSQNIIDWASKPLGSVVSIDITFDPGSVIVSEYAITSSSMDAYWTFTTISDPVNWNHPVSGNRTFGCVKDLDGKYTFYIQGADRLTDSEDVIFGWLLNPAGDYPLQFRLADNLWNGTIAKIATDLKNKGISCRPLTPVVNRPNWDEVRSAIKNGQSLSTINCK